jgi:hypothetical protein
MRAAPPEDQLRRGLAARLRHCCVTERDTTRRFRARNIAVAGGSSERKVVDISRFHSLIVSIHVIGVILFVVAHAVSAVVVFLVQRQRDPARLRRLLTLSRQSLLVALIGLAGWFLGGILAGFSGNWWATGRYWIWASLVLAVILIGIMTPMGRIYLNRVREAVGIDPKTGAVDSSKQVDPVAVEAAVTSGQPVLLAVLGIGGLAILYWLMVAKPF